MGFLAKCFPCSLSFSLMPHFAEVRQTVFDIEDLRRVGAEGSQSARRSRICLGVSHSFYLSSRERRVDA